MSDTSIPQKECTRCHETKIIHEFHRQTKSPDGYRTICKKCRALAESKVYIPYEPDGFKYCRHCEQMLPATYEYYQPMSNGKYGLESRCRSCKNAECRCYHENNRSGIVLRKRGYYLNNPEKEKERSRDFRANNPTYSHDWYVGSKPRLRIVRRVYTATRRARLASAPGSHTSADILLQRKAQTDKKGRLRCWWCGNVIKDDTYHLDHRIPLARGGSNGADNLVISCPTCNLTKNSKTPQEFAGRMI